MSIVWVIGKSILKLTPVRNYLEEGVHTINVSVVVGGILNQI